MIRCVQLDKEIKDLVDGPFRPAGRFVYLIYDNNNGKFQCKRFFEHKIGLWHWAFLGINEQKGPVGHP
ncbi:hypothetical protein ES703_120295 [subsurface metagenome]